MNTLRSALLWFGIVFIGVAPALAQPAPSAEQPASDWQNESNGFALSYRRFGWDLMSRVQPDGTSARYSLQIISADKTPIFCNAMEGVQPSSLDRRALNDRTQRALAAYPRGLEKQDNLGGSRILRSEIRMAGPVAVHSYTLETLNPQMPIVRQEIALFFLAERAGARVVSLECLIGNGVPAERWQEAAGVIDTLQIGGKAMEPRQP